ncbi:MAG: CdaR family protein [Nitrospirota bacterium]
MTIDRDKIKKIFFDNLLIKTFSLLFAITLWVYLNTTGKVEKNIVIPLELRALPSQFVIINEIMEYISIKVKGNETILRRDKIDKIVALLNLSEIRAGDNIFLLKPDNILDLPSGVEVTKITPERIIIRVRRL